MKKIAIFAAIMVKSRILQILVLIIMPCISMASNSSDTIKTWFDTWRENRKVYNAYRDSIFAPVERDAWVNLCIRRADTYRNMYRENKKMIDEMKAHFNRPDVPKADYDSLFSMCMNNGKGVDIFMAEDIMNILVGYYEKNHKTGDQLYSYLTCLYALGSFEYQIGSVGDKLGLSLSYNMLHKAVNLGFRKGLKVNTDIQLRMVMICGIMSLLSPIYVNAGLISYKECDDIMKNIRKNLNSDGWKWIKEFADSDHPEKFINNRTGQPYDKDDQGLIQGSLTLIDNYETYVFTDAYFEQWQKNPSEENRQLLKAASAKVDIETLFKSKPHLIPELKWALEQIDADEAYRRIDSMTVLGKNFTAKQILGGGLAHLLDPMMSMYHIMPFTSMNDEEKHNKIEQFHNEFTRLLRICKGDNDLRNIVAIEHFVTNKNALKYLSVDEKLNMLNQLMMSAQINTFAHSSHLADLAQTLVEGLIKHAPEQLVGIPGCPTVDDVKNKRDSISEFVRQAAMFHDLGKNSMAPIIANDFRPITDHEYQLVKLHPEKGMRFLKIDPAFSIYHDTTIGHHKWYNGKGGYPESFDNTKSDIRVIIDIITLCDCLEAATDAVSRNYNPTKVFADVLDEFDAQAGTRYNGDIVKVIRQNRRLYSEMERLVSPWGCYAVYYDIYKEFFREK